MSNLLPIAQGAQLREQARLLARRHRGGIVLVILLHAAAAGAGLAGPPLLGRLVQSVRQGTTTGYVDKIVAILAAFLVVQTIITWFARRASFVLSEKMFAELREDFMHRVLALPLSTVERAGTGDLVSRTTADIDSLTRTIRFAIPETLIAAVTALLTVAAAVWVSPLAALPCIAGVPVLFLGTRWYLARAPAGYLWERAAYATLTGTVGETVDGGRTIEALGLNEERVERIDEDLRDAYRAERRTLFLRTVWFPSAEFAYVLPVAAALAWGGWLVSNGNATLGQVTAVALYVVQLADPVDRLISWLDEIQIGATSFARLVGIAHVPPDRTATDDMPTHERLAAEEVRYARPIRLSEFGADAADSEAAPRRPELVVCAAVNTDEEGVIPAGRGCAPFTFSSHRIGISSGTMFDGEEAGANDALMRPTKDYEEAAGIRLVTLPAAVAVSGAAVSPAMGRMTRAPLRLLLGLANVRLGLWLPNPRISNLPPAPLPNEKSPWRLVQWQLHQPGMLSLLRELLGRTGLRGRWIYVTDGGHYENLGLVEALRRGATEIIVFDASGDAPHSWSAFGQAVETARADLGVQIDLDPTPMTPPSDGRTPTLVVEGSCTYPDGVRARLVLCKLAMPKDVPGSWDVAAWARSHKTFPHDSTAQQLYGDREFEAYRRLGELGGERALALMQAEVQAEAETRVKTHRGRKIDLTTMAEPATIPTQQPAPPPSASSPSQGGEQPAAHAT